MGRNHEKITWQKWPKTGMLKDSFATYAIYASANFYEGQKRTRLERE